MNMFNQLQSSTVNKHSRCTHVRKKCLFVWVSWNITEIMTMCPDLNPKHLNVGLLILNIHFLYNSKFLVNKCAID